MKFLIYRLIFARARNSLSFLIVISSLLIANSGLAASSKSLYDTANAYGSFYLAKKPGETIYVGVNTVNSPALTNLRVYGVNDTSDNELFLHIEVPPGVVTAYKSQIHVNDYLDTSSRLFKSAGANKGANIPATFEYTTNNNEVPGGPTAGLIYSGAAIPATGAATTGTLAMLNRRATKDVTFSNIAMVYVLGNTTAAMNNYNNWVEANGGTTSSANTSTSSSGSTTTSSSTTTITADTGFGCGAEDCTTTSTPSVPSSSSGGSLSDFFSNSGSGTSSEILNPGAPADETQTPVQDNRTPEQIRLEVIKAILLMAAGVEGKAIKLNEQKLTIDLGDHDFVAEITENNLPGSEGLNGESVSIDSVDEKLIRIKFKNSTGKSGSLALTPLVYEKGKTELTEALKSISFVEYVLFPDNNHLIITTTTGLAYKGQFHFERAPAGKIRPGGIKFDQMGDLNGDQEEDWLIRFSDGTTQVIYFDVPDHLRDPG